MYILLVLSYFQDEMMVQEDPIELEKMIAWSRRRGADQRKLVDYSRLTKTTSRLIISTSQVG